MTTVPQLLDGARVWIANARSFHRRQLLRHRKVIRVGKSRMVLTKGEAIISSGAVFAAGSVSSAGSPDWMFWIVLLGGILGGRFVFPIPVSSIASKRGPADVIPKSLSELDRLSPEAIRIYENNMMLKHRLKSPESLGTTQALWRQREAATAAEQVSAVSAGSLAALSVADAWAFGTAAQEHDRLRNRWLAYEVDANLQFDYPSMSDGSAPATAAMIKAMRTADQTKSAALATEYRSAVAAFGEAFRAAESAAGVPGK